MMIINRSLGTQFASQFEGNEARVGKLGWMVETGTSSKSTKSTESCRGVGGVAVSVQSWTLPEERKIARMVNDQKQDTDFLIATKIPRQANCTQKFGR
jgi:hypothetical protein